MPSLLFISLNIEKLCPILKQVLPSFFTLSKINKILIYNTIKERSHKNNKLL
ncbi:hypothetical protein G5S_0769 [Chlamydia pecorum E58]|uniref:Uncharacterized protein n=1 Tax=Chlamydia pecorum (strain ATCC VR-628 / DSM 29919 / E58) TaxID=331635 RepID=A0AA34RDG9_CHLPE|nr:hypothetical protein G5S_0769 [Chlamydia pecorum E58]